MLKGQGRPRFAVIQALWALFLLSVVTMNTYALDTADGTAALTRDEFKWLDQRSGQIRVGIAFVPPHTLEQDSSGRYRGVAMDFMRLLENKLPLTFNTRFYSSYAAMLAGVRSGEVDMVFAASATPEREKYLIFTQPYTFLANKIFVRKTAGDYEQLSELSGKTVAVIRGTAVAEHLKKHYPDIRRLALKSSRDLMLAVSAGNADAAVSVVASAWWHIKQEGISNLDVSGDANFSYAVRFGVRRELPVLAGILEKGLYKVSDQERDRIHRRWLHPEISEVINKETAIYYGASVALLLLLILIGFGLFSIRRLRNEVRQRTEAEHALRVSEERFELAIRGANDGIWDWNLKTDQLYLAPRFLDILGFREMPAGLCCDGTEQWRQRIHPRDAATVKQAIKQHLKHQDTLDLRYRMRNEQGEWLWLRLRGQAKWDETGEAVRLCGSIMDITENKRSEDEVRRLAYFDQLTGTANRERFKIGLHSAVNQLNLNGKAFAVMVVDLDNFKLINDALGHRMGDALLRQAAEVIQATLPPSSLVGRLGGDEFAVLLENPSGSVEVRQWAQRLLEALARPLRLDDHDLRITACIGISHWTEGQATVEKAMEQADIALFEVKKEHPGHLCFHEPSMSQRILDKTHLAKDLEHAIFNDELFLMFQPQVALEQEQVIGCEALLRWQHPERGMISPAQFIPLAEERGLIHQVGDWVLRQSCKQARQWLDQGVDFSGVGVNISSLQLLAQGFVERVERTLDTYNLPARYIELEITETVLVQDIRLAEHVMNRLRDLGIRFSIDDFGTGYSSLLYLQRLPISRLKLAQEFVRDMEPTQEGATCQSEAVVSAALHLGKHLNIPVIAEGIETLTQYEWLKGQGCDEGQGYLFSRPVLPADFAAFVQHAEQYGVLPDSPDPEGSMMVS